MYYITTPIPYANGQAHLGHLLEALVNDTFSRYKQRSLTEEVGFSMGADQHGLKVYRKSQELNQDPSQYVKDETQKFIDLWKQFEITNTVFIQTHSTEHQVVAKIIWQKLKDRNLIYKKTYTGLYCVGDEAFVSNSQLRENGMCPNHDEYPVEMKEENYFFKLSGFQEEIIEFLERADIRPSKIRSEWLNFVKEGLEDISVSREKKTTPWGIAVPNDPEQVMYVWFEALINYLTGLVHPELIDEYLEFPKQEKEFAEKIWQDISSQMPIDLIYMGKDMPKFHLVIWVGMLLGLGLPLTKTNLVHGFINDAKGRKFSKSLGNGVYPQELVERFGIEGTRFVMLHEINPFEDSNFDWARVTSAYNSLLCGNIGNLAVRVSNLVEKNLNGIIDLDAGEFGSETLDIDLNNVYKELENFQTQKAFQNLFAEATKVNQYLERTQPWVLAKDMGQNATEVTRILSLSAVAMIELGKALSIFMPVSGESIYKTFSSERIIKSKPLFEKIEID